MRTVPGVMLEMTVFLEYIQFVLAPQMITGLSLGVAVVLVALGLTIIFGLLDVINMAHGEFYAVGAYLRAGARCLRHQLLAAAHHRAAGDDPDRLCGGARG